MHHFVVCHACCNAVLNVVGHDLPLYQETDEKYEGRTESHEQLFFASELGTADEGKYGGRWNQLLCYP